MDLSITHQQSQRLLKQRNLLASSCLVLFSVSVMLTLPR
jgi:conjugal transfer pilus assembly protein TraE